MKKRIRKLLAKTAGSKTVWDMFWRPVIGLGNVAQQERSATARDARLHKICEDLKRMIPDSCVVAGPFAGMQYPTLEAAGSALAPKLLGTYERELHPWISNALDDPYDCVIDVGAAEGFYAVGFALGMPESRVFAFDIDPKARSLCENLAEANNVSNRVFVKNEFDATQLSVLDGSKRPLIICDCEGYEKQLFTPGLVEELSECDLMIEAHDFLDIEISLSLKERFAATHHIEQVFSLDDLVKAQTYDGPLLSGMTPAERLPLVAERRPSIMSWLILTSKSASRRNSAVA